MHTDENKRFDKRNIPRNLKAGIVTQKEYDAYVAKLPDVREKVFDPEDLPAPDVNEGEAKKRKSKKGKGK